MNVEPILQNRICLNYMSMNVKQINRQRNKFGHMSMNVNKLFSYSDQMSMNVVLILQM
jgi:hypothetical protein